MAKIQLEIAGLTTGHTSKNSSYTLILMEKDGDRRIPVVIGAFEAQAIALVLENIQPQRPLTHDLIKNIAGEFDIEVIEVYISNLVEGVFYAKIKCLKDDIIHEIDARTSDAIALAVRFNCPIYTNKTIIDTAGITIEDEEQAAPEQADSDEDILSNIGESTDYSTMEIVELEALLAEAIQQEDYHRAALLRDEINRRKS
ncbi:MAG: bifunctional nuclease family protein [Flavobacteriales bacterium]|nr:bifunctional nuclease family protein [Bacteroidota bacterium]MCB9239615.1 bifunctional nuclease family protein [Flavobacteriales bacterium]